MSTNWIQDLQDKHVAKTAVTTLIVDGNPFFSGVLENFLQQAGHTVIKAETAELAIAKTREAKPDLILLNNQLEDTSALALIPEILLEHPSASLVLLAPAPSIAEAVEAIKLGATDYVEGPLDPTKLKLAISPPAPMRD